MAIPIILGLVGVMAIWNILTDPIWIGSTLNILPAGQKEDIQKKAFEIGNLLKAAKDIMYNAKNTRRSITSTEKELIKKNAILAEEKVADLKDYLKHKLTVYGRKDVEEELNNAIKNIELQIEDFKTIAGLIPRPAVTKTEIKDIVTTVFDGDTLKLQGGETVRLVGIDAPESTTDAGVISKKYLKQRLEGKEVIIASDPNALKDMYERRLGVVMLDGENINIEMLKMGLAEFYFFEPNALVFEKQWKAAATEAKQKKKAAPATKAVAPYVYGGVVTTAPIGAMREEDIHIATQQVQNFLSNLPARLDFEITTKFNPIDANGKMMEGRYQIAHVYLFSGPYKKTKITELILRKMAEGEKPLSKSEEDPIEIAMRNTAKGTPVAIAPTAATTTAPIISAPVAKNYYRYKGENEVFAKGTDRYITFEEATQKNIWDQVEVIPRQVVVAGAKLIPEQLQPAAGWQPPEFIDTGQRFYKQLLNGRWEYQTAPWAGNIPFGLTPITEAEYRQATGDKQEYPRSGITLIEGIPYSIEARQKEALNTQLLKEGKLQNIGTDTSPLYVPAVR